jgi:L-rhamnose mutarotase
VERVCFLARVQPDRLDEYRQRHKEVWPQMLAALRAAGWGNYSLFLAADGLLVGYLETEDYQAALDAMAATDVNTRWQAEMAGFFVADGAPDRSFLRIAEIFHLDEEMTQNA